MHRHQHKGRKLSLKKDQRRSLIRGLVDSLILYERLQTTLPRAKEVSAVFDKLVTKAKKGDLAGKKAVFDYTFSDTAARKLISELSKGFSRRNSGYTRIIKIVNRRGDNAHMAVIELVLDEGFEKPKNSLSETEKKIKSSSPSKKPSVKKVVNK